MEQEMPDYETICAAVVGEKWALEKVLDCYGDEINRLAMVKKCQPDGTIKEEIDEDLRQTLIEWYFKNKMNNGNIEEFDGISLIVWTENNKIMELKEFGCNLNTYNPYAQNDMPQFRDEKTKWF